MTLDARRLEELSLNTSAPPGQLLYDGWVIRLLPGKAKRARSVNAVFPSTRPLGEKFAYCERLYAQAGLPAIFRITPFVEPGTLDRELEDRGYGRFETTCVASAPIDSAGSGGIDGVEAMTLAQWADAVGALRGSTPEQCRRHQARIEGMPLVKRAVGIRVAGQVVATGLTILEDEAAGVFDIVTDEAHRRAGHARRVVASLLAQARDLGAREAYLQVEATNAPALRLYEQFGFEERYRYWYRGRPGEQR